MKSTIPTLARWGAVALMVGALAGCGGSDDGTAAAPPGGGAAPPPATGVTAPTGTAPVTLSSLTAAEVAALTPVVTVGSVTIASPPQVSFAISDGAATDNPILGFGAAGSTGSLSYLRFALAKLVPGTSGSPSKWVSYIVTSTTPGAAQRPSTDNTGTIVDNGNGTYTYTFARDITKAEDEVAAMTLTAPNVAADLGDLSYDPNLTHRLVIQLSGGGIANPVNAIYDFIPATGQIVASTDTQRQVVSIDSCNRCHEKLAFHGSARIDTQYCVVCHTDQRKYGRENVASTALAFPALTETATVNATTGITSYSYTPSTYVADGEVSGDFTTMIHKIHQGTELVKQNYHYAGVVFNNKGFSMLGGGQKMCTVCHDNAKAAQADNWNTVPSRLACGACHDGINFATGAGTTLGGATTGHVGKGQSSDATCALCHSSADIKVYHQTENVTEHNPTVAAGLASFTYEVKSAAVDAATGDATVEFKISKDGTALTTLAPTGFNLGPSFLRAYATDATATDGIASPIDYNNTGRKQAQPASTSIANLLNGTGGSISGPDASGYFTAKITNAFPLGAKMRAVALQGYYSQTASPGSVASPIGRHALSAVKAVTGDTERRKVIDPAKCSNCHEWFEGHGGNRNIGPESASPGVCVFCHVPGLATSGRGVTDAFLDTYAWSAGETKILTDWGFSNTGTDRALNFPVVTNNLKDMVHGIHAGRDRVSPMMIARDSTSRGVLNLLDFRRMDFPGKLNNCETCHITGTYANVSASALASTYESIKTGVPNTTAALAKAALSTVNDDDTVTSPFAASCVSCHDSVSAQAHMSTQGGMIMVKRSTFAANMATPGKGEACATCHGTGKAEDVTVKHK